MLESLSEGSTKKRAEPVGPGSSAEVVCQSQDETASDVLELAGVPEHNVQIPNQSPGIPFDIQLPPLPSVTTFL